MDTLTAHRLTALVGLLTHRINSTNDSLFPSRDTAEEHKKALAAKLAELISRRVTYNCTRVVPDNLALYNATKRLRISIERHLATLMDHNRYKDRLISGIAWGTITALDLEQLLAEL